MQPVLIIGAVPQETALLERTLIKSSRTRTPGCSCFKGMLGSVPVIICSSGIGKINAAATTTALIERHQPQLVINTGCAGAFPASGLSIGDLVVASVEVLADEGVHTTSGWLDLQDMNMPSLVQGTQRYFNEIPLSLQASEKAMQLADQHGVKLVRGRFLTVSACSGSQVIGDQLAQRTGGICENMEGAAVALVCLRYSVDCLEIRGISNLVEDRNMKAWDIPRAVETAQRFVLKYLGELDRPETTSSKET